MGEYVIKLPDIGEGIAEAELVEWMVKEGDIVREDTALAAVMTDKATVEIPAPVDGKVAWLGPAIGDLVAVGTPIIRLEVAGAGNVVEPAQPVSPPVSNAAPPGPGAVASGAPLAAPAVRARARELGIDLALVRGTGPEGRITDGDLDAFVHSSPPAAAGGDVTEVRVVGLRRRIAERMSEAHAHIAPITYVDEVDVTALEALRAELNEGKRPEQAKLTLLPFLMCAMTRAISDSPEVNAHFDDEAGIVRRFRAVHLGVATQTDGGLVVPVVRHAEDRDLRACAQELARLSEAARNGTATREELSGSTITITSLGALGGIATTPIINRPEVAIVGVNKIRVLPVWDGHGFAPRKMMNLSSSFDHRVVDGWNAAVFIQRVKEFLEAPANLVTED